MNNSFWHSTNHVTSRHVTWSIDRPTPSRHVTWSIDRPTPSRHVTSRDQSTDQHLHVTSRHVINRQTNTVTSRHVTWSIDSWQCWQCQLHSVRLDIMTCVWPYGSDHPRVVSQTGRGQSRLDARLVCCCRWWGWWRCNGRIDGFHSVELGTNCDVETIVWLTTQQQAYVLIRRHRHQNTQTDRQTDKRTDRQTDRRTDTQTDGLTDRQKWDKGTISWVPS